MINRSQNTSLLLGISFGLLLGAAASSFAWLIREDQHNSDWLDDYGNALAGLSAGQAIDAMLNHDLVSLQVILQDVMSNPRMLSATIHDVENKLLVQAGLSLDQLRRDNIVTFSQAIPLHNSDAGYVTVVLNAQSKTQTTIRYTITGVGVVLLILLIILLRESRLFASSSGFLRSGDENEGKDEVRFEPQIDAEQEPEVDVPVVATAKVLIYLINRETLSNQLSHQLFVDAIDDLERMMQLCAEAYGGRSISESIDAGRYRLEFPSQVSADEARYRAVCFSALVQKRYRPTTFRIDLSFLVALEEESVEHRAPEPSAIVIHLGKQSMEHELRSRIICHEDGQDYCTIKGFPAVVSQQIEAQNELLDSQSLEPYIQ